MKLLLFTAVVSILAIHQIVNASFTHGQPCSVRNTAYLYVFIWRFPDQAEINCVDITGFKKRLSTSFNISDYSLFMERASGADTLYADHMRLKRFPAAIVHALPNIEVIDMSGNRITKLPAKMDKIAPKLSKLLLSENRIIIPKTKPLMSSSTLKTLMLSDNGITNIYKFTFAKLPALEVLYLDSNKLTYICPRMFALTKNLKYLHLGQNYLKTIPPKNAMPKSIVQYITKSQRTIKRRYVTRRNGEKYRRYRKQVFSIDKLPQ